MTVGRRAPDEALAGGEDAEGQRGAGEARRAAPSGRRPTPPHPEQGQAQRAQDVLVEGVAGPGDEQPVLIGIFRFDDGRFAEMWGVSAGFPAAASPEELLG